MISRGKEVLRIKEDGKGVDYTNDGGQNWFGRTTGWVSGFGEITDLIDGGDEILAQTSTGRLLYSENNGDTWREKR